jgi:hypothetical protein
MMRRPGLTVEVGAASPALMEVAVRSDLSVLETRVDVEDVAVLSSEFCVIVEVDAERELADEVPRWVSLSCFRDLGNFHDDMMTIGVPGFTGEWTQEERGCFRK